MIYKGKPKKVSIYGNLFKAKIITYNSLMSNIKTRIFDYLHEI